MRIPNLQLMEVLQRHGAKLVFSGHFHQNALTHSDEFGITNVVTTSAASIQLGKDTNGFRLVRVGRDSVDHQFFALTDMPSDLKSVVWSS